MARKIGARIFALPEDITEVKIPSIYYFILFYWTFHGFKHYP
jgi:hypothetical protein